MANPALESIPNVAEVALHAGREADGDAPPTGLIEVPHGATRAVHFEALASELRGPFPADVRDFFFVNTDVGAPEVATALARGFVEDHPEASILTVRCLVPRTFLDCNRIIEPDAKPTPSAAGEVTPGLAPYVRDERDQALLLERYAAYRTLVTDAIDLICGNNGSALLLHSYAPREIDVAVDDRIVERLREAYEPERLETWPLRPDVDLIVRSPEGEFLASTFLFERVRAAFKAEGMWVGESLAYPLHPVTMAHHLATRHRGQTLCMEIRRDLLVEAFTPFQEMIPAPEKVERVASTLRRALLD